MASKTNIPHQKRQPEQKKRGGHAKADWRSGEKGKRDGQDKRP